MVNGLAQSVLVGCVVGTNDKSLFRVSRHLLLEHIYTYPE